MPIATITSKGQVTIPKEVRDLLDLRAGDKLVFTAGEDGTVKIEPATLDLRALAGRLKPAKKGATLEHMDAAIRRGGSQDVIALDTNVLVRFLVKDDPRQCRQARTFVNRVTRRDETLLLTQVVACETVWVLDRAYGFDRAQIGATLQDLFRSRQIALEEGDAMRGALAAYRSGAGDFSDYLIRERSLVLGAKSVVTFDKVLLAESGFRRP